MFQFQNKQGSIADSKQKEDAKQNVNHSPEFLRQMMEPYEARIPQSTDPMQFMVDEEEEEPVQGKMVQMQEEKEEVQAKADNALQFQEEEELQAKTGANNAPDAQQSVTPIGTTTSMPEGVQAKMENSFGTSFSNVNIHQNDTSATNMGALAYTQGNDVHFAPGQYNPGSQKGQELLGHELTHVVQQRQGRVQPTKQGKGMTVNDSPALENEADVMGKLATEGRTNNSGKNTQSQHNSNLQNINNPVQKVDTPTPQSYKKFKEFKAMTLNQLHQYANEQADWHVSPHLNATEVETVRKILSFTREDNIRVNCGNFLFADLNAQLLATSGNENQILELLRLYAKVSATKDPFTISHENTVSNGVLVGIQNLALLLQMQI